MSVFDGVDKIGLYFCPHCETKQRHAHGDVLNKQVRCINCTLHSMFLINTKNGRLKGERLDRLIALQKRRYTFEEPGFKDFWDDKEEVWSE